MSKRLALVLEDVVRDVIVTDAPFGPPWWHDVTDRPDVRPGWRCGPDGFAPPSEEVLRVPGEMPPRPAPMPNWSSDQETPRRPERQPARKPD